MDNAFLVLQSFYVYVPDRYLIYDPFISHFL